MSKASAEYNDAIVLKTESDSAVTQAKIILDNANQTYNAAKAAKIAADANAGTATTAAGSAVRAAIAALDKAIVA